MKFPSRSFEWLRQSRCFWALLLAPLTLAARSPDLVDVKVFPADVHLSTKADYQSLAVQAFYDDGTTRDVTEQASYSFSDKTPARIERGVLRPAADGTTELKIKFGGRSLTVPVKVDQSQTERPISFALDVMPVFMKVGCNTGSCHGSSRGKDGFRLSLFGFDPDGDYFRITRENIGRRINLALPEESLLLEKGAGQVQHTGGARFKPEDALYQTVLRWVKAGAPTDGTNVAHVVDVEMYPKQAVLEGADTTQRLTVRARYSDGTDRDVTSLAVFMSNNDVAVKVSELGLLTAAARGEAYITARFETHTVGMQALSVPKGLKFQFPTVVENNYIDTLVDAKLKKLRIAPSEVCDDATFLRRVYIDLTGTLPTPEQTRAFVADLSSGKRTIVIDELLNKREFADLWVMKWAELLQIRSTQNPFFSYKNALTYYDWLQDNVVKNVPVNVMVKEILTGSGGTLENPPANYYKIETDTLKTAENAAQVFMGMRIQCAQCHNHPFDRWTMNDYYSFAAFFAQVGRKNGEDPRETIIFNRASGEVKNPVNGHVMEPKFLGGERPDVKNKDRREVLANWIASPENPYFARNIVNIVWAHFTGRGIINPVDDVRVSNPPSNPELLDALATKFTESNYDFKKLVREICNSRTYQLSTRANDSNKDDLTNFSKAAIRRMRAEVMLDAINEVTESEDKFRGLPKGTRAVNIADGNETSYFLTTFGRATRESVCSCEVKMEPSLSQALHLLNGTTVNDKIQSGGVIKRMLKEGKPPKEVLDELYQRCFSRLPTPEESAKLLAFVGDGKGQKPEAVLDDVFWSLLNSKEFIFNH